MRFIGLFIIVIAVVTGASRKWARKQQDTTEAFWKRETDANFARRKDISDLPYITIPLDTFPIGICQNSDLLAYEATLRELATKQILNLSGESNTDLKLKYGAANLPTLSECDDNFAALCCTIAAYGECLLDLGYEKEAQTVLEYGISCGTDISKNYLLLGQLYQKQGDSDALTRLKEQASALRSVMKNAIVGHLDNLA